MGEHIGRQPAVVQAPTPKDLPRISGVECKALRKRLKLTQQEFADRLGICRTVVVRGERTAPSILLTQMASDLFNQEKLAQLRLQVQERTELIETLTLAREGGLPALLAQRKRLQQENTDLRTAIRVIARLDKSEKLPAR